MKVKPAEGKLLLFLTVFLSFLTSPIRVNAQSQPVSLGAVVSSSNSINSLHGPANVVDGNQATAWFTGAPSPQWILLDLKNTYSVNRISLDLYMDDNSTGRTVHSILAGPGPNNLTKVIDLDQNTRMGQHIEIPLLKPIPGIRYVKIIIQSPSHFFGFREVSIYAGSSPVKNHLFNFGYYYGFSSEMVSLLSANITTMFYDNLRTNLAANYSRKLLTILSMDSLFFDTSQRHYTLKSDWLTRWNAFTQEISGLEHTIYALYFDEPTSTHTISESDFLLVTNKIRQTYPSKPIMIAEGGSDFPDPLLTARYMTNVTDIGFDFYFIRNGAPDNYTGWGQFLNAYDNLEAIAGNRKIWLIPESIAQYPSQLSRLPDVFERYLSFALTKNNVAGLLVYKWPLDLPENINYSVRSLVLPASPNYNAAYAARLKSVGTAIIANPSPTPISYIKSITVGTSLVSVSFANPGARTSDWIGLYPSGSNTYLAWKYLDNTSVGTKPPAQPVLSGTVNFARPASGNYQVRYVNNGVVYGVKDFTVGVNTTTPTRTPTPVRIPGDLTDQGDTTGDQVNIFDYNLLVSNFGNPYTIFNYNELLSNFGK